METETLDKMFLEIAQTSAATPGFDWWERQYRQWPDDIRRKLSIYDLRRMTGWRPRDTEGKAREIDVGKPEPEKAERVWAVAEKSHRPGLHSAYYEGTDYATEYIRADLHQSLEAERDQLQTALSNLLNAEWMVSHDWGGDREAVISAAEKAVNQKQDQES